MRDRLSIVTERNESFDGEKGTEVSFSQAARTAFASIKEAILPGYILLACAALFVISYYHVPAVFSLMEKVGNLKREWGYTFSCVNSAFFAGMMPWVFRMFIPGQRPPHALKFLIFSIVLWGVQGITIDTLYRVQGLVFGTEVTLGVIVCKVLVDQFIYSLFFSSVLNSNAYYWADSGYSFEEWKKTWGKGWYKRIVLPNYIANLTIWIPGVSIVYCLPLDLQIFMAGLVGCLYSLIAMYIATKSHRK